MDARAFLMTILPNSERYRLQVSGYHDLPATCNQLTENSNKTSNRLLLHKFFERSTNEVCPACHKILSGKICVIRRKCLQAFMG